MAIILEQVKQVLEMLFNKTVIIISACVGVLLSAVGYPKEILTFIVGLIFIDLITKQYSLVIINFKEWSIKNYFQAWVRKILTSRQLKNGLGVKALMYIPVLYGANMAGKLTEIITGNALANGLYTALVIIEFYSIMENFIDCGHTELVPFLKLIKKKEDEILK